MIAIMHYIVQAFIRGEGAVPMKDIRQHLGIHARILGKLLSMLVAADMLNEVKREEEDYDVAYAPARDVSTLRINDVLEAVDNYAEKSDATLEDEEIEYQAEEVLLAAAIVQRIKCSMGQSEDNILIKDIANNEQ